MNRETVLALAAITTLAVIAIVIHFANQNRCVKVGNGFVTASINY